MGRVLRFAAALVVSLVAVIGLLVFLQSRDTSTLDRAGSASPAGTSRRLPDQGAQHRATPPGFRFASDPPTSGPHLPRPIVRDRVILTRDQVLHALEVGDVVLRYGDRGLEPDLLALQEDVAGPFDRTLAGTGQALVLQYAPGTDGVIAQAWRRLQRAPTATDPRLRTFADAWLGAGARG